MLHLCGARGIVCAGSFVTSSLNRYQKTIINSERFYNCFRRNTPVKSCKINLCNGYKYRLLHNNRNQSALRNKSTIYYLCGVGVLIVGLSYAAVPMYRIFCQAFSSGGVVADLNFKDVDLRTMKKQKHREITILFNADRSANMAWNFRPQINEIKVSPGETALTFYTAQNPLDRPVIGVSTYNVVPFEVGQYFNKIQCFCFEEQMLNPHEQVDMPVFFYIDPEFAEDPKMENVDNIVLSYTFFEVKEGMNLPLPPYYSPHKK